MTEKPEDLDAYRGWLREEFDVELGKARTHYNNVVPQLRDAVVSSDFWDELKVLIDNAPDEYSLSTGYDLFATKPKLSLATKEYEDFFEKTYRKNVIENNNWPDEPQVGWYLPPTWFEQINDILRTMYVVKYLDGVDYLLEEIRTVSESLGLDFKCFHVAEDEGYYAVHTYTTLELTVPTLDLKPERRPVEVEIQITTQLQEVIRQLLHQYYSEDRLSAAATDKPWQWNYDDERFFANHLGHILNYVEGMIMEVRD